MAYQTLPLPIRKPGKLLIMSFCKVDTLYSSLLFKKVGDVLVGTDRPALSCARRLTWTADISCSGSGRMPTTTNGLAKAVGRRSGAYLASSKVRSAQYASRSRPTHRRYWLKDCGIAAKQSSRRVIHPFECGATTAGMALLVGRSPHSVSLRQPRRLQCRERQSF